MAIMTKKQKTGQEILSLIPGAFIYYLKSSKDAGIFYDKKYNVFLDNVNTNKKIIKDLLLNTKRLYDLYNSNIDIKNWAFSDIREYEKLKKEFGDCVDMKEIVKSRLDYLLLCIYACEVKSGASFFCYMPPYFDDITNFALMHRQNNYDLYKEVYKFWTNKLQSIKDTTEKSIYVQSYAKIKKMISNQFGDAVKANNNYLLDDKTVYDLINRVKKYPLFTNISKRENSNYQYRQRFLVGYYNDKPVLFTEVIRTQKDDARKDENSSYQLNVVLNGDIEINKMLYRMDFKPNKSHINKLESLEAINNKKYTSLAEYGKDEKVANYHIHIPTEKYCVLFPNFSHSADAKEYEYNLQSQDDFLRFNNRFANIQEEVVINNQKKTSIQNSKQLNCLNLIDFLEKKEEIR